MVLSPARLSKIPRSPGVYTFTRRGVSLYVGKAADLRGRLRAYLPDGEWKADMVREATGLRVEQTGSELEALLLEAARISTLQPKYNVEQRSERSFLSILVTTDEDFPQVIPTRSHRRAGTYIGPFTSARAVRETLRVLRKVFPYRCTNKPHTPHPLLISPSEDGRGETTALRHGLGTEYRGALLSRGAVGVGAGGEFFCVVYAVTVGVGEVG